MLSSYLKKIAKTTSQGDAREESYYGALSELIYAFSEDIGKRQIQVTVLPKKTEAGNPDFRIWDGKQHIIGYIEAKKPNENLEVIETSDQLKRYRSIFPNLILTDFYNFRFYRDGNLTDSVSIGRSFVAKKLQSIPALENEKQFLNLLEKFFSFSLPKVYTAETLASELAKRTRFLRDEVITIELEQEETGKGSIYGFYNAFKKYLIADLSEQSFADIYSQTITYGLFAARTRANSEFNRMLAFDLIPPTIGILRDVFHFISLGKVPLQMEVIIDDIAEVLQTADVNKILHQYFSKGKGEDPIVHFYETFLSVYDPEIREKRGVYYTPEPVVKYIVRTVHSLLKTRFNLIDGLASREVTLLDPAGGTLTFPAEAIKIAVNEFIDKYGDGGKDRFIKTHILKNYYSFELMMAPYTIGHIKIGFLLEELSYKLKEDDRFNLFLTNTLDMEDLSQTEIPGLESLSEESHLAGNIKKKEPILVIIGNPPYSGHSANRNEWTDKLLKENTDSALSYYYVDGKPLGEKNPKWLQDDYVKFLRFAQWKIHKAGQGIVGMITNHSYLNNPTFRGMRQSLINTFNEIYIIDLHGNALKKETAPDGSKDENVFDIRQGVAIAIFVKQRNKKGSKIFVSDLYGERESKYKRLNQAQFDKKNYTQIKPSSPYYFFKRENVEEIKEYLNWWSVNEIFPVNSVGIVTARDELTIKWSASEMWNTILQFYKMDSEMARITYNLGKDSQDWKISWAQDDLKESGPEGENICKILYRPFDIRFTYYTGKPSGFLCRPRREVMNNMLKSNLALISHKREELDINWGHALITDCLTEHGLLSSKTTSYHFPLYLYKQDKPKHKSSHILMLFEPKVPYAENERRPNLALVVFEKLQNTYKKKISPEMILFYVYAILYSNIYRKKYAEFLRVDFPRIPFTSNFSLFKKLADLGEELVELHLLNHKSLNKPVAKYRSHAGNHKITKPRWSEKDNRVYINEDSYLDGINSEVWNYFIGGYQVMNKYLKERKGKIMDEPEHYCKMATSISKTIEVQTQIDKIYPQVENNTIL